MRGKTLPGFRDFYPEELTLRNHIFATWRSVATRYGFEEYDGPPLEALDLYTQKSGEEIVQQLYTFRDKGDRNVALRPEMTPTLARMVAARVQALQKPIRWFSIPQLFRYERQERGWLVVLFQPAALLAFIAEQLWNPEPADWLLQGLYASRDHSHQRRRHLGP